MNIFVTRQAQHNYYTLLCHKERLRETYGKAACMNLHCRSLDAAGTRTEGGRGAAWRLTSSKAVEADAAPLKSPVSVLLT